MNRLYRLTEKIIFTLAKEGQTITFAESCTGGRLAAAFTAVPGASSVLEGACITYANEIKHRWLGVNNKVLETYGAVSRECVSQMLDGAIRMAEANYATAISGIAGPAGGTPDKPVGTVYIGIKTPQTKEVHHCFFSGDRESIQQQSVSFAIEKLAALLKI